MEFDSFVSRRVSCFLVKGFFHYVTREIRGLELFSEELLTRFYEDRGIKTNGGGFMALRLLITSCYSGEQEALDRVTSVAEESQALASQ